MFSVELCRSSRRVSPEWMPHFPTCIHCLLEASTQSTMFKTGLAKVMPSAVPNILCVIHKHWAIYRGCFSYICINYWMYIRCIFIKMLVNVYYLSFIKWWVTMMEWHSAALRKVQCKQNSPCIRTLEKCCQSSSVLICSHLILLRCVNPTRRDCDVAEWLTKWNGETSFTRGTDTTG